MDEVGEWIIQERETREKLKKEKAEVREYLLCPSFVNQHYCSVRQRKRKKPMRLRRKRYGLTFCCSFTLFSSDSILQKEEEDAKEVLSSLTPRYAFGKIC